tara:strand:+ start:234 stop:824 length:591 start_codon:yes stop_codon:yes gene_type:complete
MKLTPYSEPSPHILLEDVFTSNQLDNIWREINFITPHLTSAEYSGSAHSESGTILKKNRGLFLHKVYVDTVMSPICQESFKVAWKSGISDYWISPWLQNMYNQTNWNTLLLSYYENTDHYKPHIDESVFTMLLWLWKEPKKFSGGNLYFPDANYAVECKNNCGIIFMSNEKHAVDPIILDTPGYGRYCISVFSGIT